MQKIIFPALFFLMTFACTAQDQNPSFMLSAGFHGKDDGSWIQKITRVQVQVLDGKKAADAELWTKLSHDLHNNHYDDLLTIRKGTDRVQLLSKEGKEGVKELAFLAGDKDGGVYIQFAGKFTQEDVERMLSSLQEKDKQ